MTFAARGVSSLVLLLYCLLGTVWSLTLSKERVQETVLRNSRDTLYVRNPGKHPVRVEAVVVDAANRGLPAFELAFRAGSAANEVCFGRGGAGVCPPLPPTGRVSVPWVIPPGDSLALFDFNLAPCIRCPLGAAATAAGEDTLSVALTLLGGEKPATFRLEARLGPLPGRPRAGPAGRAHSPVEGDGARDTARGER